MVIVSLWSLSAVSDWHQGPDQPETQPVHEQWDSSGISAKFVSAAGYGPTDFAMRLCGATDILLYFRVFSLHVFGRGETQRRQIQVFGYPHRFLCNYNLLPHLLPSENMIV